MERLTTPSNRQQVRGFLTIHSTPSALRHHIDWAIQAVLGTWVKPTWTAQPLIPGSYRMQLEFRDRQGAAAELASSLRSWHYLNFEIIENTDNGGELFRCTPELGIHRASIDGLGNIVVTEHQVMDALAKSFDEISMREAIDQVLGNSWEEELAPFREVEIGKVMQLRAI